MIIYCFTRVPETIWSRSLKLDFQSKFTRNNDCEIFDVRSSRRENIEGHVVINVHILMRKNIPESDSISQSHL
jgi:hypothetical protein